MEFKTQLQQKHFGCFCPIYLLNWLFEWVLWVPVPSQWKERWQWNSWQPPSFDQCCKKFEVVDMFWSDVMKAKSFKALGIVYFGSTWGTFELPRACCYVKLNGTYFLWHHAACTSRLGCYYQLVSARKPALLVSWCSHLLSIWWSLISWIVVLLKLFSQLLLF